MFATAQHEDIEANPNHGGVPKEPSTGIPGHAVARAEAAKSSLIPRPHPNFFCDM